MHQSTIYFKARKEGGGGTDTASKNP